MVFPGSSGGLPEAFREVSEGLPTVSDGFPRVFRWSSEGFRGVSKGKTCKTRTNFSETLVRPMKTPGRVFLRPS